MSKRKVLYVCHNHPSVRPGGAETYALELYEAMRAQNEFEPIFVARSGPPMSSESRPHEGTLLGRINKDPNQYLFYTDAPDFDRFYGSSRNKEIYTTYFHELLSAYQPDVVHFQHTVSLGYDLLRHTRNTLPDAAIVYTLHDYLPICHSDGIMVRTHHQNQELCRESSPRRCHECFPEISQQAFFMRQRFIESHLSLVDLFLAPSHFLLERYVEWGIPREKIRYEEYGRRRVVSQSVNPPSERPANRIGFFGQFNRFKGVDVLLEAMQILGKDDGCVAQLWLHGANLDLQPEAFQGRFKALVDATKQNVRLVGRYDQSQIPSLMENIGWVVVPSTWWENSPLVIQEAFQYGRPVICSNIGGMAEKVTHGVNGLHFRVGDPESLAQAMHRAVSSPDLWEKFRSRIPEIYDVEVSAGALADVYRTLLEQPRRDKVV
jgi:glycosyltransferase involved in cell wall biosynthesis